MPSRIVSHLSNHRIALVVGGALVGMYMLSKHFPSVQKITTAIQDKLTEARTYVKGTLSQKICPLLSGDIVSCIFLAVIAAGYGICEYSHRRSPTTGYDLAQKVALLEKEQASLLKNQEKVQKSVASKQQVLFEVACIVLLFLFESAESPDGP